VSAFALIFGLDQSKTKFRAFQFPFGIPEEYGLDAPPLEIVVHSVGWTPTKVAVPALGTLKDLGYYIDTDLGGEAQFKVTLQRLTTALEAMKHKFRGTKGREYAVNSVLMARIAYTGQGANLKEAQIQKLDSVTLEYARKELRLLPGFPAAAMSHHHLINYPLPSTVYHEAKLGSLWRNLGRGGRPAQLVQEYLRRAMRTRGYDPDDSEPVALTEDETWDQGTYWINGIINGLGRSELQLARGGDTRDRMDSRRHIREQDGWGAAATELRRWGITSWSDMFNPEGEITEELAQRFPTLPSVPGICKSNIRG
jgi:hypothetical protein